jgi:hypothetical protein
LDKYRKEDFILNRVIGVRKYTFHIKYGKREWLATAVGVSKCNADGLYHPTVGNWAFVIDILSEVLAQENRSPEKLQARTVQERVNHAKSR